MITIASPVSSDLQYDRSTVVLHWITAALVAALWLIAQAEDLVSKPERHLLWSVHIATGMALLVVVLTRLGWRASRGLRLPAADAGALGRLSKAVHRLLYALVAATIVLGIVNMWARGWDFGGVITIPGFAVDNRPLRRAINEFHDWAANATVVVAGLHAAAALFHHYLLRDGVLRRMSLARRR